MSETTKERQEKYAEALAKADGLVWGPGESSLPSFIIETYCRRAEAVTSLADEEIAKALEISDKAEDAMTERRRRRLTEALGLDAEARWGAILLRAASLSRHAAEPQPCGAPDCLARGHTFMRGSVLYTCTGPVAEAQPLSPYYEHPACGFRWHGRDGLDVPLDGDGQPLCPRCETERLRAEVAETETARDAYYASEQRLAAELERLRADRDTAPSHLADGIRAAADEIAGIDFHPKAHARALDLATGLVRRLRRLADEAQQPETEAPDEKEQTAGAECAAWNADHPVGAPVRVWTGARKGDGILTRTRTAASVLGGHTAVVWVDGHGACIALTHVDPLPNPTPTEPEEPTR